jgi:hypothetical protein
MATLGDMYRKGVPNLIYVQLPKSTVHAYPGRHRDLIGFKRKSVGLHQICRLLESNGLSGGFR